MKLEKLESWPVAFDAQARKINEIIDSLNPLINMVGRDGIVVKVTDNNVSIGFQDGKTGGGGGSGLPSGYGAEEWTVYDDGIVTTRNFITDNPD